MGGLKRAGIQRKDGLGRVLHFRSFGKTRQSLGVAYGIDQPVAQEILGHSDPSLTANVSTDVANLQTHEAIAKLPWIGSTKIEVHSSAQKSGVSGPLVG